MKKPNKNDKYNEETKNLNEENQEVGKESEYDDGYTGYVHDEDKKPSVFKKILKAIGVCIILGVYAILFLRFFFSCDSKIVDDIIKTDEIVAAYESDPEGFEIRQYEITDWYASKDAADDERKLGGKLLAVSNLNYIPATETLQVTLKFNLDILKNREVEYSSDLLPFEVYLIQSEDEEKIGTLESVIYDERYSFGYMRMSFDGVRAEKFADREEATTPPEDPESPVEPVKEDDDKYYIGLVLHMYNENEEYSDEVYDIFSIYSGKSNYKILTYK